MAPRGNGIVIQISGDGANAAAVLDMVRGKLRETGGEAKHVSEQFTDSMEQITRRLEMVGIVVGVREAIESVKELVSSSLEMGETLEKASKQTGLAVETLSVLHYAAAITGTEFESLTSAVSKMDKTIGAATQGDKKAEAFMRSLGLNAKELASRSDGAEIAFKKFTSTLAATENPIRRVELATGLLGKAGAAQIPMLLEIGENWDKFKQKAQAAGVFMTGEQAAALEATNQRLADMKQHALGASLAFTEGLTPGMMKMIGTISAGANPMAAMNTLGKDLAKTFAFAGEVVYSAGAALESLFSAAEGGKLTDAGRRDYAAAVEMYDKAQKLHDQAFSNDPVAAPETISEGPKGDKGRGFAGVGNLTPGKSTDGIARAAAALASAQAEAIAKVMKDADDSALVANESWHKLMLISDEEFYAEKLRLELQSIDAEETALRSKRGELESLLAKQQGDKLLKRDKSGQSAEELTTKREIVQLDGQINKLESDRTKLQINNSVELQLNAQQERLAVLRIAAQVEAETNTTIDARLALMRAENALAIQKAGSDSPEAAQLEALERVKEAKLQIGDIDRQIRESEADNKRATDALADHAAKDPRFKLAAAQQINKLNADEAAQLKVLVAQYDALAQTLGGPFLETAKNLHAEMDKLNTPNKKSDADFTKTLGDGFTHMAEQIGSASLSGKNAFHQMAQSIEKDVISLAIKLAMQKWLTPLLSGAMGLGGGSSSGFGDISPGNFPGFADGGDPTGPSMIGEKGPELFFPKGPGTVTPNSFLSQISEGGGGKAPSVTMNVTNASSQPVTARQTGSSYDSEMKQFIIHTVLEDHAQGGPIAQASQGG